MSYATKPYPLVSLGHRGQIPIVELSWPLTAARLDILRSERQNLDFQNIGWNFDPKEWANTHLHHRQMTVELPAPGNFKKSTIAGFDLLTDIKSRLQVEWILNYYDNRFENPFAAYTFCRIAAERDIVPEKSSDSIFVHGNGHGVTNVLERFINDRDLNRHLVEKTLLDELNKIFIPDASYSRIIVQQQKSGEWEVFLEEDKKGLIPLSQTGSGLKTVLLVLANLIFAPLTQPQSDSTVVPLSQFLFGFEELENNLHPAAQRRLLKYLRKRAIDDKCHFFITTHSNVVIDLFSNDVEAQLLHVTHDGECATVQRVDNSSSAGHILDDLDIRASDLLQANVVVWVEGPSDKIYFDKWIELWSDGGLVEGVHYQCVLFGGSCNAHFSFDQAENTEKLIQALRVNRHAILLIDSDRTENKPRLKKHTLRLQREVNAVKGHVWITFGKEVENYIPGSIIKAVCKDPLVTLPRPRENTFEFLRKRMKPKLDKPALAREVVKQLTKELLHETLDLSVQLSKVTEFIRIRNGIQNEILS